MTILSNDPSIGLLTTELNAQDPAETNDVVLLINDSASLLSQLNGIDRGLPGTSAGFTSTGSADTIFNGSTIGVIQPGVYGDLNIAAFGGSLTQQQDPVTPSGIIVGDLAKSLARELDGAMAGIDRGDVNMSTERDISTRLLDLGKQDYAELNVKKEIERSYVGSGVPAQLASGSILFDDGHGPLASTVDIKQVASFARNTSTIYQNTVGYFGSTSWNTDEGQAIINNVVAASQAGNGAADPLFIDWSHVTDYGVVTDGAGDLVHSDISTNGNAGVLNYSTNYDTPAQETTKVTDGNNNIISVFVFDTTPPGTPPSFTLVESNATVDQSPGYIETFQGSNNTINLNYGLPAGVVGDSNAISDTTGAPLTITGKGNAVFAEQSPAALVVNLTSSSGTELVLNGSAPATITGSGSSGTVVFAGGNLQYNAGNGTLILGNGSSTISGGDFSGLLRVYGGGGGSITYAGSNEYADVIGDGTAHDTISAGAGGGWYEGGSGGFNQLTGNNATSAGTILQAGGNGDTLAGGAHGGAYLLAAGGNETLNGGNSSGTNVMFAGSGNDLIYASSGSEIINSGTGSMTVTGGNAQVYGGTGHADEFVSGTGNMTVYGFRVGIDHVQGGNSVSYNGSGIVIQEAHGSTITLSGISSTDSVFN